MTFKYNPFLVGSLDEVGTGGSGSQTPWTSDIDGGGYSLTNADNIIANGLGYFNGTGAGSFTDTPSTPSFSTSHAPVSPSSITGTCSYSGSTPIFDDGTGNVRYIDNSYITHTIGTLDYITGAYTDLTSGAITVSSITYNVSSLTAVGLGTVVGTLQVNGNVNFTDDYNLDYYHSPFNYISYSPTIPHNLFLSGGYGALGGYSVGARITLFGGDAVSPAISGDAVIESGNGGGGSGTIFLYSGAGTIIDPTQLLAWDTTSALQVGGDVNITGNYKINSVTIPGYTWYGNVNANGYDLSGAGIVQSALISTPEVDITTAVSGETGLVYHWLFNETSGWDAYDTVHSNDAVAQNRNILYLTAPGKINLAFAFPGDNYLAASDTLIVTGNSPWSVSFWVKTTATTGSFFYVGTGSLGEDIDLQISSQGYAQIQVSQASGTTGFNGNTVINDGNWHWLEYSWDGATTYIYVDNILQTLSSINFDAGISGYNTTPPGGLLIGNGLTGGATATMDDLRYFNISLDAAQRNFIWNYGLGTEAENTIVTTTLTNDSSGNLYSSGNVYAPYFYGDGSHLTGVVANLTPWNSDIDGAGFNLTNVNEAQAFTVGVNGLQPTALTTIVDSIGANNLTPTNVVSVPGKIQYASQFDGKTNDIAEGTDTGMPTGNSPASFSMWVRIDQPMWGRQIFFSYGGTIPNGAFMMGMDDTTGALVVGNLNTLNSSNLTITDFNWHHVVMAYDGADYYPYLDGVAGTPIPMVTTIDLNGNFWVGTCNQGPLWNLVGSIEDFRCYSSDITSSGTDTSVVSALYNSGSGTYSESGSLGTNLLRHYRMNDGGAPTKITDTITVNGNGAYSFGNGLPLASVTTPSAVTGSTFNLYFDPTGELNIIDSQGNTHKVLTSAGSTIVGPFKYMGIESNSYPYWQPALIGNDNIANTRMSQYDATDTDQSSALNGVASFQSAGGNVSHYITDQFGNLLSSGSVSTFTYNGTDSYTWTGPCTQLNMQNYPNIGAPVLVYLIQEGAQTEILDTEVIFSKKGNLAGSTNLAMSSDYQRVLMGPATNNDDSSSSVQVLGGNMKISNYGESTLRGERAIFDPTDTWTDDGISTFQINGAEWLAGYFKQSQQTTPDGFTIAYPPTGTDFLYFKSGDTLWMMNSSGLESQIFTGTAPTQYWQEINPQSATYAYMQPLNADRLMIDPTNSLTDDTTSALQVNGNAKASAWVTSGGTSGQYVAGDGTLGVLSGIVTDPYLSSDGKGNFQATSVSGFTAGVMPTLNGTLYSDYFSIPELVTFQISTTGLIGRALNLSDDLGYGTSSVRLVGNGPAPQDANGRLSVSVIFKAAGIAAGNQYLWNLGQLGSPYYSVACYIDTSGEIRVITPYGDTDTGFNVATDTNWHQLVITFGGTLNTNTLRPYLDTALGTVTPGLEVEVYYPQVQIGGGFQGLMEDFRYWGYDITNDGTDTTVVDTLWNGGAATLDGVGFESYRFPMQDNTVSYTVVATVTPALQITAVGSAILMPRVVLTGATDDLTSAFQAYGNAKFTGAGTSVIYSERQIIDPTDVWTDDTTSALQVSGNEWLNGYFRQTQQTTPDGTTILYPPANSDFLYFKSDDNLYTMDSTGAEHQLARFADVTLANALTASSVTPIADNTYTFDVTVPNTSISITTVSGIITAITIS